MPAVVPAGPGGMDDAVHLLRSRSRIVIKAGGGARAHHRAVRNLAARIGAPVVLSPGSTGVLADGDDLNMHVGGSKGSISGNHQFGMSSTIRLAPHSDVEIPLLAANELASRQAVELRFGEQT